MNEEHRLKFFSKDLDFRYLLGGAFPKLSRGKSDIHGEGIIALESIKKGNLVCPLFGILYAVGSAKIDYPKYSYQISDKSAIETVNEPGFVNHSCEPNVFVNSSWIFEAISDIKEGEEIVLDYGTVDFFDYGFDCHCGSDSCRRTFDGKISGDKAFQEEKGTYFSPYLKEKFLKIK